jgi:Pvc16 N-terminal domain
MSNGLSVATVTATLTNLIGSIISTGIGGVPGARVTHLEPSDEELSDGQPIVNVFLIQVTRNPSLFNQDLPTRRADGSAMQTPLAAIDLNYLLSFYGNQSTLEPQRLLGCVVAGLHAEPLLSPSLIASTVASTSWLAGSNLATSPDRVRLTPIGMTSEQMSQLWKSFFDFNYCLSILCQASGLMVAWPEPLQQELPVRQPHVVAVPMRDVVIERITDAATGSDVLIAGNTMAISGRNLAGGAASTVILLDEQAATPSLVTPKRLEVPLDTAHVAGLAAGPLAIRVLRQQSVQGSSTPQPVAGSTIEQVVLHPAIIGSPSYANGNVQVTVAPAVQPGQIAELFLNPTNAALAGSARVALPPADAAQTSLSFPVTGLAGPGTYLVRLAVGGAQSVLAVDTDRTSGSFGRYIGPTVVVTA